MLANRLKYLRMNLNMSQQEIARQLKMSKQVYNNYELGKREPDYETLKKIAFFFNISIDYLLETTNNPAPQGQLLPKPTMTEIILSDNDLSEESRKDLLKQYELLKLRDDLKKRNEKAAEE